MTLLLHSITFMDLVDSQQVFARLADWSVYDDRNTVIIRVMQTHDGPR